MRSLRAPALLAAATLTTTAALVGVSSGAFAAPTDLLISEYVEGSSNNKAVELHNGTGAPVDLAGYTLSVYFNGSATPGLSSNLTGTVAAGGVFVFAHSSSAQAILDQADATTGSGLWNGDDAIVLRKGDAVVDSFGQVGVDPGAEWGTGLTSTADNTLRRKSTVDAGDTDPSDAFDPAAQWDGFAVDTFDGLGSHSTGGGPVDAPAVLTCGSALVTSAGTAATRDVTATDADDTITSLVVTGVTPTPAAGEISRTGFTPATGVGGTATATVSVTGDVPAGTYAVALTSTDDAGTTASCTLTVQVNGVLTVGAVQGQTTDAEQGKADRSPLAPASGNSQQLYDVRGVVAQRTLSRTSAGAVQYGFFLQSSSGFADGDPLTSDGIFVYTSTFPTLIGGYQPVVGDEIVIRARVTEYFNLTQLASASLVSKLASGVDVAVTDAVPPVDLAEADRFWERHEGMQLRVRAGAQAVSGRDVFASTADSEVWVVDKDDPLLDRADPYARRVFRDSHPLDNNPARFDDENGNRIMFGSMGVKDSSGDSTTLLPPAHTFDTLTSDAVGGLYYSFEKYGIQPGQVSFAAGADPSRNNPPRPADRNDEFAVATYNVENLYDFRDDPFDGCDFLGNTGCPGVSPPFDYVPVDQADYDNQLAALASQITRDLHSPDVILVQEAEDQDICTVSGATLACGTTDNADGAPDTIQELALTIKATGGPAYAAAYDRDGADDRGITAAFLYRTDRVTLAPASATDAVLGANPTVSYRAAGLGYNTDVQNPKSLNADLPSDVDTSTGVDGSDVFTRAPQVAKFLVAAAPGSNEKSVLWAVSNHYSSTPDGRVGQRREQARYGAAIVTAIEGADPNARVVYGGDLNVFPRPDDPVQANPGDQLAPLYDAGLHNLWEDLVREVPSSAYSYSFEGQSQTLDHLFVNAPLYGDLVQMRAAHINADWPANHAGDGSRGSSDHDPQVARFSSRASLTVADAALTEGDTGTTTLSFTVSVSRPLSQAVLLCGTTLGLTARAGSDYDPVIGCRTLPAGATSTTVDVTVKGDRQREQNETLTLIVAGIPGLVLADPVAIGTIRNDD
ncbi:lamin tail domain-containing protein [Asanoa sp. WMMD1127]|uniref:lamin tail domain-containing protein n=1 Tax=Asanoa sp. WMMD1127 TaxID=3016107 RepID=UPI0024171E18|nr:lamin tail domain-containing protein [Asanoa sp. WMMD1127]MDG4822621.1 lamin tail domain-containing protein [Asanoa sp. WMMD1127]